MDEKKPSTADILAKIRAQKAAAAASVPAAEPPAPVVEAAPVPAGEQLLERGIAAHFFEDRRRHSPSPDVGSAGESVSL